MRAFYSDIFQEPNWMNSSQAKGWGEIVDFGAAKGYINHSKLFGRYLYIQHAPLFSEEEIKIDHSLPAAKSWGEINFSQEGKKMCLDVLENIEQFCRKEGIFAVVIEPLATANSDLHELLLEKGYLQQEWSILPRYPMYIDLEKSEEELSLGLEKKTRYNIRYAQKKGVDIKFFYPEEGKDIEKVFTNFYEILASNASNKGYDLPNKKFFLDALKLYKNTNSVCIATAEYQGKIVSANYSQFSADWAGSYYTANSRAPEVNKLKASYLLKWETILEAKRQGRKVFDMWGVKRPNLPKDHPEYGYGRFKLGFNPIQKTFSGRLVKPLQPIRTKVWLAVGELRRKL
ncbi:MAG: lipid II:glycine glycyltransferase FemX [Candidatus Dojkabacteria bacterium]